MKAANALVALLVSMAAMSGCIGAVGTDAVEPNMDVGTGAIKGLLVDDRFRPIHLVDGPPTSEHQAQGFILVQEVAKEIRTNENGEFEILNLAPGTYTLKVQSSGHEALATKVTVEPATANEATVEARRIVNNEGSVIVQQRAVFIPCAVWIVAAGMLPDCTFDQGDDAMRPDFQTDLSMYPDLTYVVTEMRANRADDYGIQIRAEGRFAVAVVENEEYVKIVNQPGVVNDVDQDAALGPNKPFNASAPFQTILFAMGDSHKSFSNAGVPGVCCGYGIKLGTKGHFIQSAFIGEPDMDIERYALLA